MADFDPDALRRHRLAACKPGTTVPMSAADLAAAVGTSKAQILAYEQGRQVPEPRRISQLADVLGTHPKELAKTASYDFTSLADLRRVCGHSAQDVVDALVLSPKAYRRFETHGIVPARHPALVDQVARLLRVPRSEIEATLRRSPLVKTRIEQMKTLLDQLRSFYVEASQPWQPPRTDDPTLVDLAGLLGRSPSSIARLLRSLFASLRHRYLRVSVSVITATYEVDPARRRKAEAVAHQLVSTYEEETGRLAIQLDIFFREALPSDNWLALVRLQAAEPWTPAAKLDLSDDYFTPLVGRFFHQRCDETAREYSVTSYGMRHAHNYAAWYRALYPSISVGELPRPRAVKSAQRMPQDDSEKAG
jgi:transcriptional regulator with XRE-family HTH domain